jgi:hypothetical protein
MQDNRKCLLCNKPLIGRADKKFCDETCRNTFNNKITSQSRLGMRSAQSILSRNRKILHDLLGNETRKSVNLSILLSKGYHFDYLTCVKKSQSGELSKYCFEFGLRELDNEIILIER